MTPGKIKYIRGLLRSADLPNEADKKKQCLMYSGGRTDSLTKMTESEGQMMIEGIKSELGLPAVSSEDQMRRYIIAMAHELGWNLPGTRNIDMKAVNTWCLERSGFLKPLDRLNYWELTKAVTSFQSMHTKYLTVI